jgi:peptide/nickel transport system substrate-binding protein
MDRDQQRVDSIRRQQSELENHVIDEFFAGRISRREFVRRSTVLGMGLTSIGAFLAACGQTTPPTPATGVKKGGKMTVAIISPSGAIDPIKIEDEGGLAVLGQAGEYLVWSDKDLKLRPVLAESWTPNANASVWTFKIRKGVTFNDGTPFTAKDVAATINTHADPKSNSNALSALGGVISKGGATATDDTTVQFTLDAPNGSFPYLVSSDNYNVIILPASYDYSTKYEDSFIGTGPWKKTSFTTGKGVSYAKNPNYWDKSVPNLDNIDLTFFGDDQSRILSIQGGTAEVISQFAAGAGQALFNDSSITTIGLRSSAHRQVHMRTDTGPFTDKRVRQAMALLLDRPTLVTGLFKGKAEVGNDSPFAPAFPFTDTSVPQRTVDVTKAKQLLSDAGKSGGFSANLYTWNNYEIPDLAQLIQNAAKQVGINLKLNVLDAGTYYDKYWLASDIGITDYGHRGVPNVFLTAPLQSTGTWNAAHFANSDYDNLVKQYVAASDLPTQRKLAGQIETLLLDQTPIIFPYFYYHMSAAKSTVTGVEPTAMGHISMRSAGFKS